MGDTSAEQQADAIRISKCEDYFALFGVSRNAKVCSLLAVIGFSLLAQGDRDPPAVPQTCAQVPSGQEQSSRSGGRIQTNQPGVADPHGQLQENGTSILTEPAEQKASSPEASTQAKAEEQQCQASRCKPFSRCSLTEVPGEIVQPL